MEKLTKVILAALAPIKFVKATRWPREYGQARRMAKLG